MIFLDTSVLAYPAGEEHPYRSACREVLSAHGAGRVDATTTCEVLQAFAQLRGWWRRPRADAAESARLLARGLNLVATTPEDLERGLTLFRKHPELTAFDAVLAAVAIRHRCEALVSAEPGFARVSGLTLLEPTAPELDDLLAE